MLCGKRNELASVQINYAPAIVTAGRDGESLLGVFWGDE